ncbi:hypothetical protein AU195_13520, partial [Mycobacterium sp. IS-1496]|uniref:HNH endonuclease signature motif containing protein n=1 Tax=Mycobacterium sp. IS-1496 TaxID=1772284 RepID=UPI0007416019
MFDGSLPEIADLQGLDYAALVSAAAGWARVEAAAAARKQATMAELFGRATSLNTPEDRDAWFVDPEKAVGNELGAAQNISAGMAINQALRGVMLRDRLPKVGALFADGLISDMLARAIVYRTALVTDPAAMAAIDTALAEQVTRWGAWSEKKTQQAIDALVAVHDPGALRRKRTATNARTVEYGSPLDEAGFTTVWARLYASDAAALEERLDELAHTVCSDDPRTLKERHADAVGALAAGATQMHCECGNDTCEATRGDHRPRNVIVHVVTTDNTLTQAQARRANRSATEDVSPAPTPEPSEPPTESIDTPGASVPTEPPTEPIDTPAEPDRADGPDAAELTPDRADGPDAAELTPDRAEESTPAEDPAAPEAPASTTTGTSRPAKCQPTQAGTAEPEQVPDTAAPEQENAAASPEDTTRVSEAQGLVSPCPAEAYVMGGGLIGPDVLAGLLDRATIRTITHPGTSPPENRYRPSQALQDFVRARDLTCRFPRCDRPAHLCDIDHAVPYPAGPTSASDLRCLCREHHLLKT